MANTDIRIAIMQSGFKQYEVAEMIGIAEGTFSRWLRNELPAEKKQKIMEALKNGGKNEL